MRIPDWLTYSFESVVARFQRLTHRQKTVAASVTGGVCLLLLFGWAWSRANAPAGDFAPGIPMKCTAPDCGKEFTIDRADLRDYPRGEHGEGYRCKKCGRFTARLAVHCPQCGRYFVPANPNNSRCPYCNTGEAPASSRHWEHSGGP